MPHRHIELMIYYVCAFDLHLLSCRRVALVVVVAVAVSSMVHRSENVFIELQYILFGWLSLVVGVVDREVSIIVIVVGRIVWIDLIMNICSPQWDTDRFIRMQNELVGWELLIDRLNRVSLFYNFTSDESI